MLRTTTVIALALAAVPFLGTTAPASAETRRVSTSEALQTAVDQAKPGDVIQVAGGKYAVNLTITADGTAERPITLAAAPGAKVVLSAADDSRRVLELSNASHWRIEGLGMRGTRHAVVQITGGTDVTIRGCEIYDSAKKGIIANGDLITIEQSVFRDIRQPVGGEDTQGIAAWAASRLRIRDNLFETPGDGVLIGGAGELSKTSTDVRIYRNHFHVKPEWYGKWHVENGVDAKNVDGLVISDNVFHGYHGHEGDDPMGCAIGVVTRDPEVKGRIDDVRIERNTIYDVNRGIAAQGADGPGAKLVIRDNVFARILDANGPEAKPPAAVHLGDWNDARVEQNTFVDVEFAVVHTHGKLEGFAFRDNVLRRTAGLVREAKGGVVERTCGDTRGGGKDDVLAEARFVDEAGRNYRLAAGSPCAGKGARHPLDAVALREPTAGAAGVAVAVKPIAAQAADAKGATTETSSDAMMPDEGEAPAPPNDDGRPVDWAADQALPEGAQVTPESELGPPVVVETQPGDGAALDEEPPPPAALAKYGEEEEERAVEAEAQAELAKGEANVAEKPAAARPGAPAVTSSKVLRGDETRATKRAKSRGGCAPFAEGSMAGGVAASILLVGAVAILYTTLRRRRETRA
jgi:nitrous oxidase accessory protein NosD